MQATLVGLLASRGLYLSPLLVILMAITYVYYSVQTDRYNADIIPLLQAKVHTLVISVCPGAL